MTKRGGGSKTVPSFLNSKQPAGDGLLSRVLIIAAQFFGRQSEKW